MSSTLRLAAQAWVFGVLFFLHDFDTLLSPVGEVRMISPYPLTPLVLALLAQIFLVALLYAVFVLLMRRFTAWRITQWLVAVITVLVVAVRLRPFLTQVPHSRHHLRVIALLLLSVIAYLAATRFPRLTLRAKSVAGTLFAGFVIFAILLSGELARIAFWRPSPHQFSKPIAAPSNPAAPRLVWMVFDELDYYQTFGQRDPAVQLPNFDKLRAQSVLYTNLEPVRLRTFQAVPSFLTGKLVTGDRYTWDNRFQIRTGDNPAWQDLPVEDTIFAAAHKAGLHSAIDGWAIPYCHALESVVDQCFWTNHDAAWDGFHVAPQDGFLHDFFVPLRAIALAPFAARRSVLPYRYAMARDHELSIEDITAHAVDTLRNSNADVIYLHLPAPHPPVSLSRFNHQITLDGSYLDSLAEADGILGQMLSVLQFQPRWQHTTLIVQGDHGWRDWGGYGWTPENRELWARSPHTYHPLVLIHRPGQTSPETVSTPAEVRGTRGVAFAAVQQMHP
jgi:hypothetical protein